MGTLSIEPMPRQGRGLLNILIEVRIPVVRVGALESDRLVWNLGSFT